MCGGSGGSKGGGGGSTNGDAGQPGEVVREANKANESAMTSALRDNYKNSPVKVSITEQRGGVVKLEHALGTAYVNPVEGTVQVSGRNGRPYKYRDMVKGLQHFESLGGFTT